MTDRSPGWVAICGWTVVPAALLVVWHFAATAIGQPWVFPTPAAVGVQLLHPFRDHFGLGSLWRNTLVSLVRVGIGFAVAAVVGVTCGLLLGSVQTLRGLLEPLVELLRPLCPIAWLPFAIAVFKLKTLAQLFGMQFSHTILDHVLLGMVFILFWGAFFPIFTNTLDGVLGVRRNYLHLAQILGAGRFQSFIHVRLPAAAPMILTGFRQGIGTCWFVIIAAEMLPGSDSGIGYLLRYAADLSAMDLVIAVMVIIGVTGALLNFAMRFAMRAALRWHGKEV
ncbi:MAG: ABC transporter permease [Thermoguttaceae bacterium]|jgi:NitT/TauT family transport system permease protein|nr:ABC transporter permease [Thermoguttaceae bacterium]